MEDRLCWKDLIQNKENPLSTNLLPNVEINNKQSFDEKNNTINRLNEDILKLKRKTQFVDEKDKKIEKLELQVKELKKDLQSKNKEFKELYNQLNTLNDLNLTSNTNDLELENDMLKQEIEKLKRDNSTNIDFDYKVKVENSIILNTERIKNIINSKSGYSQDDKVDMILKRYKLKNKDIINRTFLSKIINDILHV